MNAGESPALALLRRRLGPLPIAAWALLAVLIAGLATGFSDARRERVRGDFAKFSLAAAQVLYEGGNPYDKGEVGKNYKYFPLNATLLGPFTLVPRPAAQGAWFALNLALLLLAMLVHADFLARWRPPWWVWMFALALAARFLWQNLKMGQWNTSVYALSVLGVWLAARRPVAGGVLVALAGSIKYLPFAFLAAFGLQRNGRAALGVLLGAVLWLLVVPTAILGPARHGELLAAFRDKARDAYGEMRGVEDVVVGYSLRTTLFRYLHPVSHQDQSITAPIAIIELPKGPASLLSDALVLAVAFPALWLTWRLGRRGPAGLTPAALGVLALWFLLFLLASPEVRKAHLLTVFTPLLFVAAWWARAAAGGARGAVSAALGVAGAALLASSTLFDAMEPFTDAMTRYGSWTLLLAAVYAATLVAARDAVLAETADQQPS
ncbi:MAG: glycosyltransferase family 87 protein [Candidatus Sumerlaeia bacterium]|nr:glycosyltransferase family 87 protein [Candidatus Sumerlaeia bacterium]